MLNINLRKSRSWLAAKASYELLSPKIAQKTWERNTQLDVAITTADFQETGLCTVRSVGTADVSARRVVFDHLQCETVWNSIHLYEVIQKFKNNKLYMHEWFGLQAFLQAILVALFFLFST